MTDRNEGLSCAAKMWLLALAIGLGLAIVLAMMGAMTGKWSLILGLTVFLVGGALMAWLLCSRDIEATEATPAPAPAAKPAPAPEPAANPAPAPEPAAAPASVASETDYDGDGIEEGTDEGTRPAALDGPRGGAADDLKLIKGIGPKLEKLCNSMGFYHFDQIAAWTADEIAWVNANLEGFKGRVSRDNWVEQAKTLAAGGSTEFANRVKKGDVYD